MRVKFTNNSFKKLRIHQGEHEWDETGGLVSNDIPNMICLIFKIISPYTRIGVSYLKDETGKETQAKFGNNVKYLLGDMYSNYCIIIDKRELHEDYVRHIFRDIF